MWIRLHAQQTGLMFAPPANFTASLVSQYAWTCVKHASTARPSVRFFARGLNACVQSGRFPKEAGEGMPSTGLTVQLPSWRRPRVLSHMFDIYFHISRNLLRRMHGGVGGKEPYIHRAPRTREVVAMASRRLYPNARHVDPLLAHLLHPRAEPCDDQSWCVCKRASVHWDGLHT